MDIFEDVRSYYCMKICVHKIKNQIYVSIVFGPNYILKSNNVFMTIQLL